MGTIKNAGRLDAVQTDEADCTAPFYFQSAHRKDAMILKNLCFLFLQCTWGFLPTLVGGIFFLWLHRRYPHRQYRGCIDTQWNTRSGLSLGFLFCFPGLLSIAWGQLPYTSCFVEA